MCAAFVPLAVEITDSLTVGEMIVGAGTLLLALFTVYLGWETRKSARAARDAVESSEVPFVIASASDEFKNITPRTHEQTGDPPPLGTIHRAVEDDGERSDVTLVGDIVSVVTIRRVSVATPGRIRRLIDRAKVRG